MRWTLLLMTSVLVGCAGRDRDGDGYRAADDCNDEDETVNPGANEVCDEVDNDCDGTVDEGVTTPFYLDSDGDGYGDRDTVQNACAQPDGFVPNDNDCNDNDVAFQPGAAEYCEDPNDYNCDGSVGYEDADRDGVAACEDCDDANPDNFPGNVEVCDGADNDCDGDIDVDTNPLDANTWYFDGDQDGYGWAEYSINACDPPFGYVGNPDDCDDTTEDANPGAEEVCDGIDNDCDDTIDGPDSADAVPLYTDADGDGYGDDALGETIGCPTDEGAAEIPGDCADDDEDVNPGAEEVCNDGIDNNCDSVSTGCSVVADDAQLALAGENAQDFAGFALTGRVDLDNDGNADLLVSSTQLDTYVAQEGGVYVMYGPLSAGSLVLDAADALLVGETSGAETGNVLEAVGDLNNDGLDDVAIASRRANNAADASGSVYIMLGGSDRWSGATDLEATADHEFVGARGYSWLGSAVLGPGDINGDGIDDLIAGANGDDSNGQDAGTIVLLLGDNDLADLVENMDDGAASWTGPEASSFAGGVLGGSGDMDGDGLADFAVGFARADGQGSFTGAAFIISGQDAVGSNDLTDATAFVSGDTAGDRIGDSLAGAGDVDGDGLEDLWVGGARVDTSATDAGAIYLVGGVSDLSTLDGTLISSAASITIYGGTAGDGMGSEVAGDTDFDGDGTPDVLIGVSAAGEDDQGAAYLFLNPASGSYTSGADEAAVIVGDGSEDGLGTTVAFGGDLFGTGGLTVLAGSWTDDPNGTDSGGAFVFGSLGL